MPRRSHQLDPETLHIVIGREHVQHLDVAAVTAAAIGVVDPERAAEHLFAKVFEHTQSSSIWISSATGSLKYARERNTQRSCAISSNRYPFIFKFSSTDSPLKHRPHLWHVLINSSSR